MGGKFDGVMLCLDTFFFFLMHPDKNVIPSAQLTFFEGKIKCVNVLTISSFL